MVSICQWCQIDFCQTPEFQVERTIKHFKHDLLAQLSYLYYLDPAEVAVHCVYRMRFVFAYRRSQSAWGLSSPHLASWHILMALPFTHKCPGLDGIYHRIPETHKLPLGIWLHLLSRSLYLYTSFKEYEGWGPRDICTGWRPRDICTGWPANGFADFMQKLKDPGDWGLWKGVPTVG